MASAVIIIGGTSTGVMSLQSEPLDTGPVPRFLVEAGSIHTDDPDASAKRYAKWIAGRPAREEAKRQAALAAARERGSWVSYSGALPTSIINCESGGSYTAENPTSSASGKYQMVDGTFQSADGTKGGGYKASNGKTYYHASDAPPGVQDEAAGKVWNGGAGASHWRECL